MADTHPAGTGDRAPPGGASGPGDSRRAAAAEAPVIDVPRGASERDEFDLRIKVAQVLGVAGDDNLSNAHGAQHDVRVHDI